MKKMLTMKDGTRILLIILAFTAVDYVAHQFYVYQLPETYFSHKILYGTVIGLIAYYFLQEKKPQQQAFWFSASISGLLQYNYYSLGYSMNFVLTFLVIHFAILYVITTRVKQLSLPGGKR
jgi:hypothetical protein